MADQEPGDDHDAPVVPGHARLDESVTRDAPRPWSRGLPLRRELLAWLTIALVSLVAHPLVHRLAGATSCWPCSSA